MTAPLPELRYWPSMNGVYSGGDQDLYYVVQVDVYPWRKDIRVVATGPMLKVDRTRGRHSRTCFVDLDAPQPAWMAAIITDARARLADHLAGAASD